MNQSVATFDDEFAVLTGFTPFLWQRRLFHRLVQGDVPSALDLPTGLGKTSVMAIWLIARAHDAPLPRRLVYIVDRRAVVDQATDEAERLRSALEGKATHISAPDEIVRAQARQIADELKKRLGLDQGRSLSISTLRGAHADNREWLEDPTAPAIIVGTVDMIGSRLLFSGYGVSRKMRPYAAGLLGIDALVVLDESHLVPPFAHLLGTIEQENSLGPVDVVDRSLLPRFVFFPLSATQRDPGAGQRGRPPFCLEEEDLESDRAAGTRLNATKSLRLEPLAKENPDRQLAKAAWELATKGGKPGRVVVFCTRRDKSDKEDDSGGPSAQGVKKEIEKLASGDRKTGRAATRIHLPELLVGARRLHEREAAAECLRALGFIGKKERLDKPAFVVATSAGEVGVDMDAEHMVCDLAPWERMVQRLGRVNRRGQCAAEVRVFWSEPKLKTANAPTAAEQRALTAFASKIVIEQLPEIEGALDASPEAIRQLARRTRQKMSLKACIDDATTPEPLRPALNRALVDAWSMTSLKTHTGRPEVAPWLRGWVEEPPQTAIVWRAHLPLRVDARGRPFLPGRGEIEDFFEAAPPQESEKLETETYRVTEWLQKRASTLSERKGKGWEEPSEDEAEDPSASDSAEADATEQTGDTRPEPRNLLLSDIVALILSPGGDYVGRFTLGDLTRERKGDANKDVHDTLAGKLLVVDARLGGLNNGLLDAVRNEVPETADSADEWSRQAGFRVRRLAGSEDLQPTGGWQFEDQFVLRRDENGNPAASLRVEHFRSAARKEDARSISEPQGLAAHHDLAQRQMLQIAKALGVPGPAQIALVLGAALHDEGKRAPRWQRAFNAPRDAKKFGLALPLAKTRGPICQKILGGYRHEFGSLPFLEASQDFKNLPEGWRELVLHLIAAHHGHARPAIETRGCDDDPPSTLEHRARSVALRFARLQKHWGPWGLAWWEALLRAADQQASRRDGQRSAPSEPGNP